MTTQKSIAQRLAEAREAPPPRLARSHKWDTFVFVCVILGVTLYAGHKAYGLLLADKFSPLECLEYVVGKRSVSATTSSN